MRLRCKIIDFVRLNLLNQTMRVARIRQISVVKKDTPLILRIGQDRIDALCAWRTVPTDHTMYLIAFFKQKLGQIRAILTCNSRNQCFFHVILLSVYIHKTHSTRPHQRHILFTHTCFFHRILILIYLHAICPILNKPIDVISFHMTYFIREVCM